MRRHTHPGTPVERTALNPVEEEILRAVGRIRYGSVEVTIHASRFWRG